MAEVCAAYDGSITGVKLTTLDDFPGGIENCNKFVIAPNNEITNVDLWKISNDVISIELDNNKITEIVGRYPRKLAILSLRSNDIHILPFPFPILLEEIDLRDNERITKSYKEYLQNNSNSNSYNNFNNESMKFDSRRKVEEFEIFIEFLHAKESEESDESEESEESIESYKVFYPSNLDNKYIRKKNDIIYVDDISELTLRATYYSSNTNRAPIIDDTIIFTDIAFVDVILNNLLFYGIRVYCTPLYNEVSYDLTRGKTVYLFENIIDIKLETVGDKKILVCNTGTELITLETFQNNPVPKTLEENIKAFIETRQPVGSHFTLGFTFNDIAYTTVFKVSKNSSNFFSITNNCIKIEVKYPDYKTSHIIVVKTMINKESESAKCFTPPLPIVRTEGLRNSTDILQILKTKILIACDMTNIELIDLARISNEVYISAFNILRGRNGIYEKYGYKSDKIDNVKDKLKRLTWGEYDVYIKQPVKNCTGTDYPPDSYLPAIMNNINIDSEGNGQKCEMLSFNLLQLLSKEITHVYTLNEESPEWKESNSKMIFTSFAMPPVTGGARRRRKLRKTRKKGKNNLKKRYTRARVRKPYSGAIQSLRNC